MLNKISPTLILISTRTCPNLALEIAWVMMLDFVLVLRKEIVVKWIQSPRDATSAVSSLINSVVMSWRRNPFQAWISTFTVIRDLTIFSVSVPSQALLEKDDKFIYTDMIFLSDHIGQDNVNM
eukprot:TRINITY_DN4967_c0_g1_i7.p3 TRINITY_DN4967_c0_g1~~TRINITY_DN4967_c0_g1_i7.p3  ORF type:complete len:130 (-),score=4.44 TRINITY_DN4967_c0_g1_i7:302-670(-)